MAENDVLDFEKLMELAKPLNKPGQPVDIKVIELYGNRAFKLTDYDRIIRTNTNKAEPKTVETIVPDEVLTKLLDLNNDGKLTVSEYLGLQQKKLMQFQQEIADKLEKYAGANPESITYSGKVDKNSVGRIDYSLLSGDVIDIAKVRDTANQIHAKSSDDIVAALGGDKHYTLTAHENVAFTTDKRPDYTQPNAGNPKFLATRIPKEEILKILDSNNDGDVSVAESLTGTGPQKLLDLKLQLMDQLRAHYAQNPGDFTPVAPSEQSSWQAHGYAPNDYLQVDFNKLQKQSER